MTSRERLMATLLGKAVDRPAVSFYEIGGMRMDPHDPDLFNIYNDPSWLSLLQLAETQTDLIRMRGPALSPAPESCRDEFFKTKTVLRDGSRFTRTKVEVAGRTLTQMVQRHPGADTDWVIEHLLKDVDDLEAFLQLPDEAFAVAADVGPLDEEEWQIGDRGIVMVDTGDPICAAASLFAMEDYVVIAHTRRNLFHLLIEKCAKPIYLITEKVAREFPGHLWRIYGPEYATIPFLPPILFEEYVVRYTGPMLEMIHKHGGFARVHCHGRIRAALPHIAAMGADATDPIEPPPQGDIELAEVRREYGKDLALFGNIEIRDIETLGPEEFEKLAAKAIQDGTSGQGKGFVLMPTACPCGRKVTATALANYETMVRLACAG